MTRKSILTRNVISARRVFSAHRVVSLLMAASAVGAAVSSVSLAADWPQFLGPDRNAVAPEGKVARSWPSGGPKVLWEADVADGFGGPAIRDGKVYILDRDGERGDLLRCLDFANGKELWKVFYDAPGKEDADFRGTRSTPTVDDKYVFTVGTLGHFVALEKDTRKILWRTNLASDYGGKVPIWQYPQSPLAYLDSVIVAPQTSQVGVIAFAKATGKILWKTPSVGRLAWSSPMLATVDGVDQVIITCNEEQPDSPKTTRDGVTVTSFDARTGKKLWTYTGYHCIHAIVMPTAIGDGRFFITGGYTGGCAMFKVEHKGEDWTVTELFHNKNLSSQIHQPLVYNGYIYANGNSNEWNHGMVCLDMEGNLKWRTEKTPNFERGGLILVDGVIFFMDGATGVLRLVNPSPEGYEELDSAQVLGIRALAKPKMLPTAKRIWSPLAFADGKLLVRDQKQMKCLDVATEGKPQDKPKAESK